MECSSPAFKKLERCKISEDSKCLSQITCQFCPLSEKFVHCVCLLNAERRTPSPTSFSKYVIILFSECPINSEILLIVYLYRPAFPCMPVQSTHFAFHVAYNNKALTNLLLGQC